MNPQQLVGDFLREAGVLIGVLWPLEDGIKNGRVSGTVLTFALFSASILLRGQGRIMSIFGSWIATLVFFFVVFLVGILLQYKEKRERLTKRAQEALRREFATGAAVGASGASTYGTVYGSPTQYERRRAVR